MYKTLFESLLIAAGCLIFLFSLSLDLLRQGSPGIGFEQFAGMIIGLIIILLGLRYLLLPEDAKWDWWLFAIYLCGILFVGLRPIGTSVNQIVLFGMDALSRRDLVENVAGFIPLGFLTLPLIRHKISNNKIIRLIVISTIFCFSISLLIETFQYFWVPGRFPSIIDLSTNTIGAFIGAVSYTIFRSHWLINQKT